MSDRRQTGLSLCGVLDGLSDKIRSRLPFRSPKDDAEKEEIYQAWTREPDDGTRFYTIGQGPLVLDTKTGVVCDGVEFLMRKTGFLMGKA